MPTDVVPLVDLEASHREVAAEVVTGFERVLASRAFVLGPEVEAFEEELALFLDVRRCVGVANGTDALELALRALGIGRGDEVVIPANTFVATAEAIVRAGAAPVLVDVDPVHHLMDVDQVLSVVSPRTAAVLPVHLFGQLVQMETLLSLADRAGLAVVEDAAQAQGARRHGRSAGTFGAAAATSFYPGKNLGAYGDAGAVVSDDDDVADKVRALRNHGGLTKYAHHVVGVNSRMDSLQAVVLRAKLRRLSTWNEARRSAAARYDALLTEVPRVVPPATMAGNEHIWHLYVVRVPQRDAVLEDLHAAGIGAGVHYPVPVHLTGAFEHLGYRRGAFPVAEAAAAEILSLPMFPEISVMQQELVVGELTRAVG